MNLRKLISNLGRENYTSTTFIPTIDGIRFIAIISVVLLHFGTNYNLFFSDKSSHLSNLFYSFSRNLGAGVNLFFAISGFVLAIPIYNSLNSKTRFDYINYFKKRIVRLEPPFLIVATFSFFYLGYIKQADFLDYIKTISYINFFIEGDFSKIIPVSWSLETEVQFYVFIPILYLLMKNIKYFNIYSLSFIIFLLTILNNLYPNYLFENNLQKSILNYIIFFDVGMVSLFLFKLDNLNKISHKVHFLFIDALCFLGFLGTFIFNSNGNDSFLKCVLQSISIFTFLFFSLHSKLIKSFLSSRLIYTIGGMCYTIYIIHYQIIFLTNTYLKKINFFVFNDSLFFLFIFFLNIFILSIASLFYFIAIEKPFINFSKYTK
jgi:peptidoglycan/LPS O-acetylase OafA/YrhL